LTADAKIPSFFSQNFRAGSFELPVNTCWWRDGKFQSLCCNHLNTQIFQLSCTRDTAQCCR